VRARCGTPNSGSEIRSESHGAANAPSDGSTDTFAHAPYNVSDGATDGFANLDTDFGADSSADSTADSTTDSRADCNADCNTDCNAECNADSAANTSAGSSADIQAIHIADNSPAPTNTGSDACPHDQRHRGDPDGGAS